MITLRKLALAISILALLPLGAMAASPDASGRGTTQSTHATTHHKKSVHHVSHKTHKPKTTSTSTQS